MIQSFRHRGLKAFYERGRTQGIDPRLMRRVRAILARLDAGAEPRDMNQPGLRLHALRGDLKGFWSVEVSGNWRLIFRFEDGDARDVDLLDYH